MAEVWNCSYKFVRRSRVHRQDETCNAPTNRRLLIAGCKVAVCSDHVTIMVNELCNRAIPFEEEYNRDKPETERTGGGPGSGAETEEGARP